MAKPYQAYPKPMILQKHDAGIRIILDSREGQGEFRRDWRHCHKLHFQTTL